MDIGVGGISGWLHRTQLLFQLEEKLGQGIFILAKKTICLTQNSPPLNFESSAHTGKAVCGGGLQLIASRNGPLQVSIPNQLAKGD
jgi:hypothetical protein